MSFVPSMTQQYLLTWYSKQPTQNREYPGVTHAPMNMSVTANDAINRFIGCWRRRGPVAMATNTRRLPESVTDPVLRFRIMNVVSSDWSHDECSVLLFTVTHSFANIFVGRSCDQCCYYPGERSRRRCLLMEDLPEICFLINFSVPSYNVRWLQFSSKES